MKTSVDFHNVPIVFGSRPDLALPLMDASKTRAEICEETDQVLGVHDYSLSVWAKERSWS